MRCKQVQALLPELLRHELDHDTTDALDRHLDGCAECRDAYESIQNTWELLDAIPEESPSPSLGERFHAMLDGYREAGMPESAASPAQHQATLIRFWLPQAVAAMLIAVVAFLAGRGTGPNTQIATLQAEITQLKDIATLQNDVAQLKDMVAASLINQQSASERMQGLSMASRIQNPDEQFLSLLVVTLNTDPDVNVRMAAVDALAHFGDNEWVRGELVKSLAAQSYPLVQISLIELLTAMQESQAVDIMRIIAEHETTPEAVRKSARWGIQQMI